MSEDYATRYRKFEVHTILWIYTPVNLQWKTNGRRDRRVAVIHCSEGSSKQCGCSDAE